MAMKRAAAIFPRPAVVVGVLTCLLLDQILKAWSVHEFALGEFREVIPGVLSMGLVYNTGAAWSLFSGSAFPLAVLRFAVGVGLLVYLARRTVPLWASTALTLIAAGALSNALDGWKLGKVVDTLSSHTLSAVTRLLGQGDFPIFNLADVWVVSGVLLLLLQNLRAAPRPPQSSSTS